MKRLGDRADVVAAIAVRRKRNCLAATFEVAEPDAGREDVHLPAGVVDVVLAVHAPSVRIEQVRDRGAEGRVPAVADVQRPRRIRGDELDDRLPAAAGIAAPVAGAVRQHAAHLRLPGRGRHEEIDESGAGDFGFRDDLVRRQARRRSSGRARAGFARAAFAACIATFVAKSPCVTSRARSTAGAGAARRRGFPAEALRARPPRVFRPGFSSAQV